MILDYSPSHDLEKKYVLHKTNDPNIELICKDSDLDRDY